MRQVIKHALVVTCITVIFLGPVAASTQAMHTDNLTHFYNNAVDVPPLKPANLSDKFISCPINNSLTRNNFNTSREAKYNQEKWEQRIAHDWNYFDNASKTDKLLVIDTLKFNDIMHYRYLANNHSQHTLYEPWSSSKIMAFTAAIAKARTYNVGANSTTGDVHLADLISSIHSYKPFGSADGNSNAIATYFLNVVGRSQATAYFYQDWLNLTNLQLKFNGAYGTVPFAPNKPIWQDKKTNISTNKLIPFNNSNDDPAYLSYRCDSCGLTGNKSMTTLAQAEWLKRLAHHESDQLTQMPMLQSEDISVLLYGTGHSDRHQTMGGMMAGISQLLTNALANTIDKGSKNPKATLDSATKGKWRIWQKIGWGPSETRGTAETVLLAQVCLPHYQGGRSFTIAAQSSVAQPLEANVAKAAYNLQTMLTKGLHKLLLNETEQP